MEKHSTRLWMGWANLFLWTTIKVKRGRRSNGGMSEGVNERIKV